MRERSNVIRSRRAWRARSRAKCTRSSLRSLRRGRFSAHALRAGFFGRPARRRPTFRSVRPPRQPYALDTPIFTFAPIASFAARAPVGGAREIALAAFVTARMASDVVNDRALSVAGRGHRAASARRWLSTLAISEPLRRAFIDLAAATEGEAPATAAALHRVIEITAGILDAGSRAELDRLVKELESQAVAGT